MCAQHFAEKLQMSLSVLGRQARRKYLLDDAHQLRITGFQSPAADDAERPLSLDALIGLGAPHIWPVRVDDNTLELFGMYQGDILIVGSIGQCCR